MRLADLLELDVLAESEVRGLEPDDEVDSFQLAVSGDGVLMADRFGEPIGTIASANGPAPDRGIVLRNGVQLIEALAAASGELRQRDAILAERSSAVLRALAQADLDGSDLQTIVTLLATLVGNPVTMKDSMFRLMAWSGDPDTFDPARRTLVDSGRVPEDVVAILEEEGIFERLRTDTKPFRIERMHRALSLNPRVVCPVRCGGVQFGFLSISEGSRSLEEFDFAAIEYGATVIAFHLFRERAVSDSMRSQRALLAYELLYNASSPSSSAMRQAAMLEIDLSESYVVAAFAIEAHTAVRWDHDNWSRTSSAMVATLDLALSRMGLRSYVTMPDDGGLVVMFPPGARDVPALVAAMVRELVAYHRADVQAVGISQPRQGHAGLRDSLGEAMLAVEIGRSLHGPGSIVEYSKLGAVRLLNEIPIDSLEQHLTSTLGDDDKVRREFFVTMGAMVAANLNKAEAARVLGVHVNTLNYRLGKIRRVTGHDAADPDGRFALECTLRLMQLQQARTGQLRRAL